MSRSQWQDKVTKEERNEWVNDWEFDTEIMVNCQIKVDQQMWSGE